MRPIRVLVSSRYIRQAVAGAPGKTSATSLPWRDARSVLPWSGGMVSTQEDSHGMLARPWPQSKPPVKTAIVETAVAVSMRRRLAVRLCTAQSRLKPSKARPKTSGTGTPSVSRMQPFNVEIEPEALLEVLGAGRLPAATVEVRGGILARMASALRHAAFGASLGVRLPDPDRVADGVAALLDEVLDAALPKGPPPAWLGRAEELIRERFRDRLTVAGIAAEAGVHPVHLTRVFRRRRGQGPLGLVRQLRVAWAGERMCREGEPLARIARAAGFVDASHMTRAFRRLTATTPAAARAAGVCVMDASARSARSMAPSGGTTWR